MNIREISLRSAVGIAMLIVGASSAQAQEYDYNIGMYGGAVKFGELNNGGSATTAIMPKTTWVAGAQFTRWIGGRRLGVRVNGAYSETPLQIGADRERNLAIGLADVGVLLRLMRPTPQRTVAPYIGVGAGIVHYGLGSGQTLQYPGANAEYRGVNHPKPAAIGSFGIDVLTRVHWLEDEPLGLRVEVSDHASKSPFEPINGGKFGIVHNVKVTLGVFTAAMF